MPSGFMREQHPRSALGVCRLNANGQIATTQILDLGIVPYDGEIVNFRAAQRTAGVGGTSMSLALSRLRAAASQAVTNAAAVLTLAAGVGAIVESDTAPDKLATPAGCTKPTLLAAGVKVKKGDLLLVTATQTGVYTTAPQFDFEVQIRPFGA